MIIDKINRLIAIAQVFACDCRANERFIGYTENEVINGAVISFALAIEMINADVENSEVLLLNCVNQIFDIIGLEGEESKHALEVALIIINMWPIKDEIVAQGVTA